MAMNKLIIMNKKCQKLRFYQIISKFKIEIRYKPFQSYSKELSNQSKIQSNSLLLNNKVKNHKLFKKKNQKSKN